MGLQTTNDRRRLGRGLVAGVAIGAVAAVGAQAGAAGAQGKIVHRCGDDVCAVDPATGRTAKLTTDGTEALPYRTPSATASGTHLGVIRGTRVLLGGYGGALRPWGPERSDLADVTIAPGGTSAAVRTSVIERRQSPRCYWTPGGMQCDYLNWTLVTIDNVFAPDGARLGGADGGAVLPDGRMLVTDSRWDEAAQATRSRLCVVGSAEGESYTCATQIEDAGHALTEPAASPDGRLLAATARNRESDATAVTVYDAASGAVVRRFPAGTGSASFSPDGAQVAFAADDGRIHAGVIASGATRPVAQGSDPSWGRGDVRGAPAPAVRSSVLRRNRAGIGVQVRCPGGGAACTGAVRITRGKALLASGRYRVRAGRTATVRVRPSAQGTRRIAAARTHRVTVTLRPDGGATVTRTATLHR